jgi:SAM-dependent methyltransferase
MFNLKKLKLSGIRHSESIKDAKFYSFLIEDIIDRLEPIDKFFTNILIIDNNLKFFFPELQNKFDQTSNIYRWQYLDGFDDNLQNLEFDLIIFPYALHWVTDVQQLLASLREMLKLDGILICNFVGGGSLQKLRRTLIKLEMEYNRFHVPHISPFIQFEHVTPLLIQAGFIETIIDMEPLELEYKSPLALMKAIQNLGQSNALANTGYSITKEMYNTLKEEQSESFIDHLNLITFVTSKVKRSIKLKSKYFSPTI